MKLQWERVEGPGVRLRKALCAVMVSPTIAHKFEGTGVVILEVRMSRDFKLAHVRWTTAFHARW